MGPIEELYIEFCERIAGECEAEAKRYEQHPRLQDRDQQFVSALRERGRRLRQEVMRLEAQYKSRTG